MKQWRAKGAAALMAAAVALGGPSGEAQAWENPFTDVEEGAWYQGAVAFVVERGLFSGTGEDTFSPHEAMSRGMLVTVLGKFAGVQGQPYTGGFSDVWAEDYYAPFVAWAAENGIMAGVGGGRFDPHSPLTREQLAVTLYHYAHWAGCTTQVDPNALGRFPDGDSTALWARQAMAWAVTRGVLAGSDGRLDPQGEATRAQTAQIFYNARNLLTTPAPAPSLDPDPAWVVALRARLEGGQATLSALGVTRARLVAELSAHRTDGYYLGTPYRGGDWQSPRGDVSYNGSAGMNCGGFVAYALRRAGMDAAQAMALMRLDRPSHFGSGRVYDILAGASNYQLLIEQGGLEAYVYSSKGNMLAGGQLEKGDLVLMYRSPGAASWEDNHMGIFWGDYPSEDLLWHSSTRPQSGNQIGPITPLAESCAYVVLKVE